MMGRRITWIIGIMAALGLGFFFLGGTFSQYYVKQAESLSQSAITAYSQSYGTIFSAINLELANLRERDSDVRNLSGEYMLNPQNYEQTSTRLQTIYRIKDKLESLSNIYGWEYHFWCLEKKSGVFIQMEDGGYRDTGSTELTRIFREWALEESADTLNAYVTGKWEVMENYIMLIQRRDNVYLGVWISMDNFLDAFKNMDFTDSYTVSVLDHDGKLCGFMTVTEGKKEMMSEEKTAIPRGRINSQASIERADFTLDFVMRGRNIRNIFYFQIGMLLAGFMYMAAICVLYLNARKKILRPLNYFYNHLSDFSDYSRFEEMADNAELDAAGKLFNKLAQEIENLKIDIYEEQIERQKIELEFEQVQIRPHFFVNCLNVIFNMAEAERIEEIQELCIHVSSYLRGLFGKSTDLCPVRRELSLTEDYLAIVQKVYGQQFSYEVKAPEELLDYLIPPLVIQTFVENSVRHVGRKLHVPVDIFVSVSSEKKEDDPEEEQLILVISDTGGGFPEDTLIQLQNGCLEKKETGHQIGITNVRERLKLIYKDRAVILFDNRDGGARVEIRIPGKVRMEE